MALNQEEMQQSSDGLIDLFLKATNLKDEKAELIP
jgi:hypothetical protein